jgi:general secretion pathway protein L
MIGRFLNWWFSELSSWLPRRLRPASVAGEVVDVVVDQSEIVCRAGTEPDAPVLARWPRGTDAPAAPALDRALGRPERATVRVRFADGLALAREIELPLAAEENLHQVIGFEMERLTPFRASEVYFAHVIRSRDTKLHRLVLQLLVAPRTLVDPVLARFAGWNLEPISDAGARSTEVAQQPELCFRSTRYRAASGARRVVWLLVLNLLLLLGVVVVQYQRQQLVLGQLDEQAAGLRQSAMHVAEMDERLAVLRGAGAFLLEQRTRRVPTVVLVEEVSALLPDGTWLSRLEVRGNELHLHGSSTAASSLLALLDESELLAGAKFASPVLRDGVSGRDRFHISSMIQSVSEAAP